MQHLQRSFHMMKPGIETISRKAPDLPPVQGKSHMLQEIMNTNVMEPSALLISVHLCRMFTDSLEDNRVDLCAM